MKFEPLQDLAAPTRERAGCAGLFLAFLRIGLMSVGGGSAGWIHREIVTHPL
jgi:chromate transport protein ChrA